MVYLTIIHLEYKSAIILFKCHNTMNHGIDKE